MVTLLGDRAAVSSLLGSVISFFYRLTPVSWVGPRLGVALKIDSGTKPHAFWEDYDGK